MAATGCGPAGAASPASRRSGASHTTAATESAAADRSRNAPMIAAPMDQPNSTIRRAPRARAQSHGRLDVLPFGVAQVVVTVRAGRRLLVVAVGDDQRRVAGPVQGRQHPQRLPSGTTPAVHQDHPGVAGRRDVPGRALAHGVATSTSGEGQPARGRVRVVRAGVQHRRGTGWRDRAVEQRPHQPPPVRSRSPGRSRPGRRSVRPASAAPRGRAGRSAGWWPA